MPRVKTSAQRLADQRLRRIVCRRLRSDEQIEADDIDVSVDNGMVTLTGSANGRWSKIRAADIVWGVPEVREVRNQIRPDHEPRGAARAPALGGTDSPKEVKARQARQRKKRAS